MNVARLTCALGIVLGFLVVTPAAASAITSDGADSVLVAADRPWTETNIYVPPGSAAEVRAAGRIQIAESDYPGKSPDGDQSCTGTGAFVALGRHCWALIGRVGDSAPVEIGSAGSVPGGSGGRLYLGINDDFFTDNRGVWLAGVTVRSAASGTCECVGYVKNRFGLTGASGHAKDMRPFLERYKFESVVAPVPGAVVIFQPSFGPAVNPQFGHVAVIGSVEDRGDRWRITTAGANQPMPSGPEYTEANCANVSVQPWAPYPKSRDGASITYWVPAGH